MAEKPQQRGQQVRAASNRTEPVRTYMVRTARLEYGGQQYERGEVLTSPDVTRRFLRAALRDRAHEVFCVLLLDTRHRVIRFEELFRGTIDSANVHPRVVVERALMGRASAVILAHNHPSGIAEPSQADVAITRRLRESLGLVDIRLLDHFIVGDGEVVSMAERGLV